MHAIPARCRRTESLIRRHSRCPGVPCSLLAYCWHRPVALAGPVRAAFDEARNRMVDEEIVGRRGQEPAGDRGDARTRRGTSSCRSDQRKHAYFDMALPIGEAQTISPPFVVAYMTEAHRSAADRQGAGDRHRQRLPGGRAQPAGQRGLHDRDRRAAGPQRRPRRSSGSSYDNVHAKVGDGYQGWPEHAPFDKIIVTCSPEKVPQPLVEQLKEGGRMVDSRRRALSADALPDEEERRQAGRARRCSRRCSCR